ncbi:MAG TPA: hypothetical protein VED66_16560 [Candidatus Sulfotelmatobacter sp.]|nr:hypothetical protein [Candidatus Sulfotelmatobacter sp.]
MENWNYFNYFTEIEEHFWKKRGAHLLVSPLDWAIMETWQKAGVPLEAALNGIDRAFESYQRSRRGGKPLKSLAYCTDAVLEAAEEQKEAAAGKEAPPCAEKKEPFSRDELRAYLQRNAEMLRNGATRTETSQPELAAFMRRVADSLASCETLLEAAGMLDLEDLERRMTILDEKIHARLLSNASEDLMLKIHREVDSQLSAYRRKMRAEQLALVEKQYLQKCLLDEYQLPRLSLYYFS